MSDTPMSEERLEVLEHDGHLASVEALTTTSATLGHELQEACREIRRLQELVDELGDERDAAQTMLYEFGTGGAFLIACERKRQEDIEEWSPEHDDAHSNGELAQAAAVYATTDDTNVVHRLRNLADAGWPFEPEAFKPFEIEWHDIPAVDRVRCLVKAGALIAAEIDRFIRAGKLKEEDVV